MPAPKYTIGQSVVAADGTKGKIVTVFDFGEDAPAEYSIKTGRTVRENIPEELLAAADDAPAAEPAGPAPAEGAPASAGAEGGQA